MPNVTIEVPENKIEFFMELINQLGLKKVEEEKKYILTEEQIALVEEERRKIKEDPNYAIDWEVARKQINWDA